MTRTVRFIAGLLLLGLGGWLAAPAKADDAPVKKGIVQVLVVGADGRPIADVNLTLTPMPTPGVGPQAPLPRTRARTDAQGIVRFSWPIGNHQIVVDAPGHGYGVTGIAEVITGETGAAPLGRLAPYAHLEGAVIGAPSARLRFYPSGCPSADPVDAQADRSGRFKANLRGGTWDVWVNSDRNSTVNSTTEFTIDPGQSLHDLRVPPKPLPEPDFLPPPELTAGSNTRPANVTLLHGTVRDDSGRPVTGAVVFLAAEYRGWEDISYGSFQTTADAKGQYELRGEPGCTDGTLIVCSAGMPPQVDTLNSFGPPNATAIG
ncbi:MAG TPA: carboxypeptidase-like regulatory domain-containing protein, partial [Tepidisphaeraceae bacterium]|nr:carboxypeptidase-like regulatory domain-containing protein [Tepidisphaeraceae bacterium]